ncbi:MAG: glycine zipper 2TM domain-containing protein [Gemmatimonadota bacterium]
MKTLKSRYWLGQTVAAACTVLLAACAAPTGSAGAAYPSGGVVSGADTGVYARYGRVTRITEIPAERGTTGAGAVIGGVLGAVIGNQFGGGNGRTAATVAGAVGGAVVGNNIEKNRSREAAAAFDVTVRLDDGSSRVITVAQLGGLTVGERVRVEGSNIVRLG